MSRWEVVSGPREQHGTRETDEMGVAWTYTLKRPGARQDIRVQANLGSPIQAFPPECKQALLTKGRSVIDQLLDNDLPPGAVVLTTSGIREISVW